MTNMNETIEARIEKVQKAIFYLNSVYIFILTLNPNDFSTKEMSGLAVLSMRLEKSLKKLVDQQNGRKE